MFFVVSTLCLQFSIAKLNYIDFNILKMLQILEAKTWIVMCSSDGLCYKNWISTSFQIDKNKIGFYHLLFCLFFCYKGLYKCGALLAGIRHILGYKLWLFQNMWTCVLHTYFSDMHAYIGCVLAKGNRFHISYTINLTNQNMLGLQIALFSFLIIQTPKTLTTITVANRNMH